jgi:hypothetical protein
MEQQTFCFQLSVGLKAEQHLVPFKTSACFGKTALSAPSVSVFSISDKSMSAISSSTSSYAIDAIRAESL